MTTDGCQRWVDQAVELFLDQEADPGEFLAGVPDDCQEEVERVLERIQSANQIPLAMPSRPAWHDQYDVLMSLGEGGRGSVYLVTPRVTDGPLSLPKNMIGLLRSPDKIKRLIDTPSLAIYEQLISELETDNQPLALKIPQTPSDPYFIKEIWNHVLVPPHRNLVKWKYLRKLGDSPCILMEYMEDGSLADLVDQEEPWGTLDDWLVDFFDVAIQCSWALKHLHDHQFVHQDIKPGNILFRTQKGERYRVGVADLGVSAFIGLGTDGATVVGRTKAFAAPEQLLEKTERYAVTASDIYSLGKVLSELLEVGPETDAGHGNLQSLIDEMTAEKHQQRIEINDLIERLHTCYEDYRGIPYPHEAPILENPVEISRHALTELSNPSSILFEVAHIWSQGTGLERPLEDIKQFYLDLIDGRDAEEGARLSLLVQIIFLRALEDRHLIRLEELRSIAKSIQPVIERYAHVELPPAYAAEYREVTCPTLKILRRLRLFDQHDVDEIDRLLTVFNCG
jgi:serine/threonine protein kinase